MANNKIRKKNTKYQSNNDYRLFDHAGGKDVFYSACIVLGSAVAALVLLVLAKIFE